MQRNEEERRLKIELEPLSEYNQEKAKVIGEIMSNYLKTHVLSEEAQSRMFDDYYEKDLSYLIPLSMIKYKEE